MTRAAVLLATVCLAGCGSIRGDAVVTGAPRPGHGADVQIFMEGQPLPGPFEEIGIVQAVGTGNYASLESVTSELKNQARLLGATVVTGVRFDRGAGSASATGIAGVPGQPQPPAAPPPVPPQGPYGYAPAAGPNQAAGPSPEPPPPTLPPPSPSQPGAGSIP